MRMLTCPLVLLIVSLDSESLSWLDEHIAGGDLPNLAHLARSGTQLPFEAVRLAGVAYPSLYSGLGPAEHGLYFPFQWSAEQQCVRPWTDRRFPSVLERADRAGLRVVILDAPECPSVKLDRGFAVSGLQFRARVLMHSWASDAAEYARLVKLLGRSPRADETFGQPTVLGLARLREALVAAPARLAKAALDVLKRDQPDCLWLNNCAMHLAAHQFFDLGLLGDADGRSPLESTRLDVARGYDRMLGQVIAALPPGSDVVVFYAKGMGRANGWVDLLPAMLGRVLGQPGVDQQPVSKLRLLIPRSFRNSVANVLADDTALKWVSRLSTPRMDWRQTRAFALPSDGPGFIRVNLQGREREGVVREGERAALLAEIRAGLETFTDRDGEPVVHSIYEPEQLYAKGPRLDDFPDLIVYWSPKSTLRGYGVRSPRFGEIRRTGVSTGRSGYHAPGAMAIVAPGRSRYREVQRPVTPEDIPVTLLAALGLPHGDLRGRPLLEA